RARVIGLAYYRAVHARAAQARYVLRPAHSARSYDVDAQAAQGPVQLHVRPAHGPVPGHVGTHYGAHAEALHSGQKALAGILGALDPALYGHAPLLDIRADGYFIGV